MKITCFLFLFISMSCHTLFAQNAGSVGSAINASGGGVFFNTLGGTKKFRGDNTLYLESGAYLFKSWSKGYITGMAKQQVVFSAMNYNVETQSLEIERNNKKEYFTPDMVKSFTITPDSTQSISFISISAHKGLKGCPCQFYQVLADGKIALLIFHEPVITQNTYVESLNVGDKSKLVLKNTTYIFDGTNLSVLKRNKKSILKAMSAKKEQIEIFIKDVIKDKDLNNLENLTAIVEYYNSLF